MNHNQTTNATTMVLTLNFVKVVAWQHHSFLSQLMMKRYCDLFISKVIINIILLFQCETYCVVRDFLKVPLWKNERKSNTFPSINTTLYYEF